MSSYSYVFVVLNSLVPVFSTSHVDYVVGMKNLMAVEIEPYTADRDYMKIVSRYVVNEMKKCDQILLYMKKCHQIFNFACEKFFRLNLHWLLHYFLEMYGSFFTE